jgi:ribosomal protein S27AE
MKGLEHEKICPQCGAPKMKNWHDLTEDQKFLVEKLPMSASLSLEQRKKNLFCVRCWHEQIPNFNEYC